MTTTDTTTEHDDTVDLDEVDETTTGDGDEGEGESTEWTPPTKDDWEKLTRTATARKGDVSKLKKEIGALKAQIRGDGDDDGDQRTRDDEARDLKTKRIAGVAALAGEGMTKAQAKLAVRMLDLSDVDLDDDGDGDFTDVIDELREAFPAMFEREEPARRRVPKVTTADKGGSGGSTRDKTTDKLLRSAGYR